MLWTCLILSHLNASFVHVLPSGQLPYYSSLPEAPFIFQVFLYNFLTFWGCLRPSYFPSSLQTPLDLSRPTQPLSSHAWGLSTGCHALRAFWINVSMRHKWVMRGKGNKRLDVRQKINARVSKFCPGWTPCLWCLTDSDYPQMQSAFAQRSVGVAGMSSPLCFRKGAQANQSLQSSVLCPGIWPLPTHCSVTIPICVYDHCRSPRGRATHPNPLLADLYKKGERESWPGFPLLLRLLLYNLFKRFQEDRGVMP